ncbi:hypothetical protein AURDEDRAFT_186723 [Auricularia subglabra TFB-10046 SS5]|nr:hypothetical protein AURDEDRAFT_186723 [Auricularia subglabra TFB-10046 SS5]
MSTTRFQLYIWPGEWGLPSIDPHSLAAALYLQLVAPGKFLLVESVDADSAPHGQLPYIVHEGRTVSGFSAIVSYLASEGALDDKLRPAEAATSVAWQAFIGSHLGTILAHSLYAIGPNYYPLTRTALASHLPVPQRYFVPARIRELYHARLESAALWDVGYEDTGEDPLAKKKSSRDDEGGKIRTAFGRERVLGKARAALDPLDRLLGSRSFVYEDRPTSLDLLLAAHILLLVAPPYPDPLVGTLVQESYPSLATHARLILSLAFPTHPGPKHVPPEIVFAPSPSMLYMPRTLLKSQPWLRFSCVALAALGAIALFARRSQVAHSRY